MTTSLITIDNQLPLFGSDQMDPALFAAEEKGPTPSFTGRRLFAQNPDKYRAIIALTAEGLGAARIGEILKVSSNTVFAVRALHPGSVAEEKQRLAGLSHEGALMCAQGILEMLSDPERRKKMSVKDLGIVFGILVEKAELLSGSPTARIQTVGSPAVEYGEYLKLLHSINEHQKNAISIGLGGERNRERAIGPTDQAPADPAVVDLGEGRGPGMYEDDADMDPVSNQD